MVIIDLLVAGTETTATVLQWAILYILHNPEVESKLLIEISNVIGGDRAPSAQDRIKMPYMQAFITEVLRCSNIAPLSIPHVPYTDVEFEGFLIPKGAVVIPNLDSVMMDPTLFQNPEIFDPKRFLDRDGKFHNYRKVIPFSMGN